MRIFAKLLIFVVLAFVLLVAGFRIAAHFYEASEWTEAVPSEGRLIPTRFGQVYVEETGPPDGRPVLLVHGSVGWSRFWYETSDALAAAGMRAIAFDLAPMGYSERHASDDYSRAGQAQRILAVAEALEIRPTLVAHSFGAGPGTEAVMLSPDAFSALVIVAGAIGVGSDADARSLPFPMRSQWLREMFVAATITNQVALKPVLKSFLHRKEAATDEYIELLRRPFQLDGTTEAIGRWLPTLIMPPQGALSTQRGSYDRLTLPVGIIWGAEDTATPLSQGEELRDITPGAILKVLPGLGHIPQIEDPKAFQDALMEMLQQL